MKHTTLTTQRAQPMWTSFDAALCVYTEDIEFAFRAFPAIAWDDYLLNPRHLRGSDFLMRWSQGQWSEHRLQQAVNETRRYMAIPYGPSSVAPDEPRAFELYSDRLDEAGMGDNSKRPDLLIFRKKDETRVSEAVARLGGPDQLPFTSETNKDMRELLSLAVVAVECENSLWRASNMPDTNTPLKPFKRLGGKLGLKKGAVLPTVTLKEEDRDRLRSWQAQHHIPIHIWQSLYDTSFGISFDRTEELIASGLIQAKTQTFQAGNGATQDKDMYFIYRHYAYTIGDSDEEPVLEAKALEDKNGKIMPYVVFQGGHITLGPEVLKVLDDLSATPQNP